jgi:hypothetical protein
MKPLDKKIIDYRTRSKTPIDWVEAATDVIEAEGIDFEDIAAHLSKEMIQQIRVDAERRKLVEPAAKPNTMEIDLT